MIEELSKYDNLGTPDYHFELLRLLREGRDENWNVHNIPELFHNRMIDERTFFDGCIPLLGHIGIINIDTDEKVSADESFLKHLESKRLMIDRFVEKLLQTLNDDQIFYDIFCPKSISLDIIYHSIQIDNAAFPLKFSCFKQLLIDFEFLQEHPTKELNKYIIIVGTRSFLTNWYCQR